MKQRLLIFALVLTAAMTVMAQPPTPMDVEPGTKGQLPTLSTIAPAQENVVPELWLDNIGYNVTLYNSTYRWCASLTYGGYNEENTQAYYALLKKNANGGWDRIDTMASNSVGYDVFSAGTYKIQYLDGENIGKYTNEVEVSFPAGNNISKYHDWWRSDYEEPLVGTDIIGTLDVEVTNHNWSTDENTEITIADGYYRYQWYRKNPNTGVMTAIPGEAAKELHYMPTINDCGYDMVLEVTGDGTHCNFLLNIPVGTVKMPVRASIAYAGNDGFILNTEYDVDADDLSMNMENAWEEPQGTLEISKRAPGQFVCRGDQSTFNYGIVEHATPGIFISFVYIFNEDRDGDGVEEEIVWNREAQIMLDRYCMPLGVITKFNGEPVTTFVEVYGPNIDGELVLKAMGETTTDEEEVAYIEEVPTLGGGCYVKAYAIDGTLDTYYPNALMWQEGIAVLPGMDEEWNTFTIEMQPTLPELTGSGVIEGVVTATTNQAMPILRGDANDVFTVYLRQKGADIVANQETDASGTYRFENVPMGSYEVLVNVDGCILEEPIEVTLTDEAPVVTGVDYEIVDDVIAPAGSISQPTRINPLQPTAAAKWYSTDGRPGMVRGLNIVRMSDGTVRKVIVK